MLLYKNLLLMTFGTSLVYSERVFVFSLTQLAMCIASYCHLFLVDRAGVFNISAYRLIFKKRLWNIKYMF